MTGTAIWAWTAPHGTTTQWKGSVGTAASAACQGNCLCRSTGYTVNADVMHCQVQRDPWLNDCSSRLAARAMHAQAAPPDPLAEKLSSFSYYSLKKVKTGATKMCAFAQAAVCS